MTNIDIAKGLIFQALDVAKETFDERLVSQKKIYLLQELGIDIGYSYNWYIRGPYSPDLTSYLFANLDVLKEQNFSAYRISENVQKIIEKINLLANEVPASLSIPSWYELLASVQYINKNWSKDNVFHYLSEYKPQYSESEFKSATDALEKLGCYC